jgi:hypothetical protein
MKADPWPSPIAPTRKEPCRAKNAAGPASYSKYGS